MKKAKPTKGKFKSSVTGKFVSAKTAARRPATTYKLGKRKSGGAGGSVQTKPATPAKVD